MNLRRAFGVGSSLTVWERISIFPYMWKHQDDTDEQIKQATEKARENLIVAVQEVKEAFKDEPATRELYSVFKNLDEIFDDSE